MVFDEVSLTALYPKEILADRYTLSRLWFMITMPFGPSGWSFMSHNQHPHSYLNCPDVKATQYLLNFRHWAPGWFQAFMVAGSAKLG